MPVWISRGSAPGRFLNNPNGGGGSRDDDKGEPVTLAAHHQTLLWWNALLTFPAGRFTIQDENGQVSLRGVRAARPSRRGHRGIATEIVVLLTFVTSA